MMDNSSDRGWLNKQYNLAREYYSVIGLKIAVAVGLFMFISWAGYIFLHEYQQEGWKEAYEMLTLPPFVAGTVIVFTALMIVLSKIIILPLKRLERHIHGLENGTAKGPFIINKKRDEIGYLAERFNSFHGLMTGEIREREAELAVINDFSEAASGVFDIPSLMQGFFNTLSTAMPFNMGAYILCHKNYTDGRIYSAFERLEEGDIDALSKKFLERPMARCCGSGFPKKKLRHERLSAKNRAPLPFDNSLAASFMELPIVCLGQPIGVISLASFSAGAHEESPVSAVFSTMVQHANIVIEKLLTHMLAEEKRLARILSSMSEGVYILDKDGDAASLNKRGLDLLGAFCNFSRLDCTKTDAGVAKLGNCPHGAGAACEFSRLINKVRTFGPQLDGKVYTEEIKNRDGMTLHVSVSDLKNDGGYNEGYVITVKDMTEDRLLQKRLMLSSKLTALGEMAAGVAHEINNPLQVMMANIELIDNVSEKGAKRIEHVKDGIFRVKNIVRDLLIFAREQTTETEDSDINTLINKTVDMMGHQLRVANVNVELDLDKRALVVKCNRNLFQQVIINLLQNAKDAIEESGKGSRVAIRTVMLPAGIIMVEVSDDGPGIAENAMDRIFDPFFTTKDVGKGTGLGLSVSRRIVEGMGGGISVASSPESGTTFTISLLHSRPANRKEAALKPGPALDYSCLTDKAVLIVDDEEGLLKAVKESISPMVSSIEGASDGRTAFERIMDRDFN
ncbi:MAG: hypothetical protein HZB21_04505, partial [Deltaproteobacteria bacterium]|nr:hypothetical protein [Deltaproteobacteria bacterium]